MAAVQQTEMAATAQEEGQEAPVTKIYPNVSKPYKKKVDKKPSKLKQLFKKKFKTKKVNSMKIT